MFKTYSRLKALKRCLFVFVLTVFYFSSTIAAQTAVPQKEKEAREVHYYSAKSKKVEGDNVILTVWISKSDTDGFNPDKMITKVLKYDGVLGAEFLPNSSMPNYLECKVTLFKGATNEYIQKMFERYKLTYIYFNDEKIFVSQLSGRLDTDDKQNQR